MNINRRYTHLFFDLDNTLWDFMSNSYFAMREAFSIYTLQIDNKIDFDLFFHVYSENNRLLWDEYRQGGILKRDLEQLRFQKTFDELQINGIDSLEMNDIYLDEMPKQKRLTAGAESILSYLIKKGYKLFIITNGFTCVQHKKLESAGIKKYFEKIFISEEIKSPKPAREIFEYALKSANARKNRSLMIGDDFEADIKGALAFGIDAVYLEKQEKENNSFHVNNYNSRNLLYQINSLTEISNII